jgi:predicted amidohydrolase
MFAIMGMDTKDKVQAREEAGSGHIQQFLSNMAKEHHVWLVGGTIPIAGKSAEKIRAASFLYDDQGHVAARYDKIHLFDVSLSAEEKYQESDTTEPGNQIVVAETPFGKIGMAVCYDLRFPELFRCLFNQGANIIVLPSAFTVKTGEAHWELLARSRAVENFSFVIGASQGGTHSSGRKTYGRSLIIGPWGNIMAKIDGTASGIIYATLDLATVNECRLSIPVAKHQQIFFDLTKLENKRN